MKMMIAPATMLLHACGPSLTNSNDAVSANGTLAAATPVEAPAVMKTAATPAVSSTPRYALENNVDHEQKTRVEELAGSWRVIGVRVAPGPVQAVGDNDPALVGATLYISPERLAWKPHKGGFFTDICSRPQIGPDESIGCAEGQFGPPNAHLAGSGVTLRLDWYDGAILTLARNQGS